MSAARLAIADGPAEAQAARLDEALLRQLQQQAAEADQLGTLPASSVALLKASQVTRLLQPREYGGMEAHPGEFLRAVMAIASRNPSAGWIAGVVGVHNWEASLNDERLLHELWREQPDTWIASPYSPMGTATPVPGGYRLSGRWTFSSGTDHCQWLVLGAMVGGADGKALQPPQVLHVMLPRPDYAIIDGTWNVVGLQGTGSKDVEVTNAFIPAYRCLSTSALMSGEAFSTSGRNGALYRMPWSALFPNAITAAVLGMCQGALEAAQQLVRARIVQANATPDPLMLTVLGDAASEITAARSAMLANVDDAYGQALAGRAVPLARRAANRSEQVRGAWRAVRAINDVFNRCGGGALHTSAPLHRFWRDANAGLNHATFNAPPVFQVHAALAMGIATEEQIRQAMI